MARSKGRAHRLASMTSGRWRCACGRVFANAAEFSAHAPSGEMMVQLQAVVPADLVARVDELAAQGWHGTDEPSNRTNHPGGKRPSKRTLLVERALRWYVERHAPRRVA